MTDLNLRRWGTEIEGLMRNGDVVPLTEVFELIHSNRYLITDRFEKILRDQAQLGIKFANAPDAGTATKIESDYLRLQESFDAAMNEVFGIDKITWETRVK